MRLRQLAFVVVQLFKVIFNMPDADVADEMQTSAACNSGGQSQPNYRCFFFVEIMQ